MCGSKCKEKMWGPWFIFLRTSRQGALLAHEVTVFDIDQKAQQNFEVFELLSLFTHWTDYCWAPTMGWALKQAVVDKTEPYLVFLILECGWTLTNNPVPPSGSLDSLKGTIYGWFFCIGFPISSPVLFMVWDVQQLSVSKRNLSFSLLSSLIKASGLSGFLGSWIWYYIPQEW